MKTGGTQLLPYSVIEAATRGDVIAMQQVLKHYGAYISSLCRKPYYDGGDRVGSRIDEDMKRTLERELMHAILFNFKFTEDDDA